MNNVLRQRLVGALVLLALGVIFWPIIFIEPGMEPVVLGSQIPEAPAIDYFELEKPKPSPNVASVDTPIELVEEDNGGIGIAKAVESLVEAVTDSGSDQSEEKQADTAKENQSSPPTKTDKSALDKPSLDKQGIPIAWVLQVASFSHRDKAEKLQEELIAMGYKADTQVIRVGSTRMVRVSVGPKLQKEGLLKAKNVIDKQFKVKSLIARYVP